MVDTRFIVSKNRFPVTIDLRDGNRVTGHFFLHFAKDETGVPESPVDLVNAESRFVVFDEVTAKKSLAMLALYCRKNIRVCSIY